MQNYGRIKGKFRYFGHKCRRYLLQTGYCPARQLNAGLAGFIVTDDSVFLCSKLKSDLNTKKDKEAKWQLSMYPPLYAA